MTSSPMMSECLIKGSAWLLKFFPFFAGYNNIFELGLLLESGHKWLSKIKIFSEENLCVTGIMSLREPVIFSKGTRGPLWET